MTCLSNQVGIFWFLLKYFYLKHAAAIRVQNNQNNSDSSKSPLKFVEKYPIIAIPTTAKHLSSRRSSCILMTPFLLRPLSEDRCERLLCKL